MAEKPTVTTLVPDPDVPETSPFVPKGENSTLAQQRQQSGQLDDDPTDSGAPVSNRHSYKNLQGGGKP